MHATRTRKAPKSSRPTRTVRVVETPDANAPDVYTVRVDVAGETDLYDVCRAVVAGRYPVWMVRKVLDTLTQTCAKEAYLVDLGEFGASCTCLAGEHRGTCRHIDFCRALVAAGKLPNIHAEPPVCETCHGSGGPSAGDLDSDGCSCRSCGA